MGRSITRDPGGKEILTDSSTMQQLGMRNGDMVYAMVDEEKTVNVGEHTKISRTITKDGNIVATEYTAIAEKTGFRPGMMALRDMKMQWTLNEFMSLDEQFVYRMKAPDEAICKQVSLDGKSLVNFQNYMWNFDFRKIRVGYLYGYFLEGNKVSVECIYEPPQDTTDSTFNILEDSNEAKVEALASLLGLKRVGWILAHPPRETGFQLSGIEVLTAAELQLICADGIEDTPFVTVKVTLNEKLEVHIDGFQVTKQCMEMVAESVLTVSQNLGFTKINPTYTVICEGKETKEVNNNFFISNVAIAQHDSDRFISAFPFANREGVAQTRDDLKAQLQKVGRQGWTFKSILTDFQLLLFLTDHLDMNTDMPLICASLTNPDGPGALDEGYQLIIRSIAGIDM